MLSLLIVVSRVISETPTCFFLNPSFQSAYWKMNASKSGNFVNCTLATFPPPLDFFAVEVTFVPAFFDFAWQGVRLWRFHYWPYAPWLLLR